MACAGVAEAVMAQFAALPKTGKPQPHEHTVLAGMALSLPAAGASIGWPDGGGSSVAPRAWPQQELAVVAIGTGTKCLGAFKRLPGGGAVNDCHAEVLCRRALLRWLYGEARQVVERYRQAVQQAAGQLDAPAAAAAAATRVLRLVPPAGGDGTAGDLFGGWRCELQPGVGLHLYISQPPCGDASILGPAASCHHPQHQHQQHQPPQETRGSQAARQHSSPEAAAAAACADSRGGGGSAQAQAGGFGRTGAKALKRQRIGGSGDQLSAAPSGPVEEAQQAHCEQQPGMQEQQQEEQWRLPQQHEVEPYAQAQAVGVVRRKPGRGDATLSMSCSDKLARWCLLGLQASALPAPALLCPAFRHLCAASLCGGLLQVSFTRCLVETSSHFLPCCPPAAGRLAGGPAGVAAPPLLCHGPTAARRGSRQRSAVANIGCGGRSGSGSRQAAAGVQQCQRGRSS